MVTMRNSFLTLLLLLPFYTLGQAQVTASVDRNPIMDHETFTLTIESINPTTRTTPDLKVLEKDFEILGNSQSSQTQIINGDTTHRLQWSISLAPKKPGDFIIPAIKVGNESTHPTSIKVIDGAQRTGSGSKIKDIDIRVSVDNDKPYVQEQIIYTIRLYLKKAVESGSIPDPDAADMIVRRIGEDRQFEELINGDRFTVFERKYALFPQTSGKVTIPGVVFDGVVATRQSGFFGRRGQRIRLRGEDIQLTVSAPPASFSGPWWLPTPSLSIQEQWDVNPPQFKVGEPITRTVILQATGLTAQQLPEMTHQDIPGLKHYPDQPNISDESTPQGLIAVQINKTAIVPTQGGEFTLPAIEIPWWNTKTNKTELAKIPARKITVVAPAVTDSTTPAPAVSLPELTLPELPAINNSTGAAANNAGNSQPANPIWTWLTTIFATLWLATLVLYFREKKRKMQYGVIHEGGSPLPSRPINEYHARSELLAVLRSPNASSLAATNKLYQWVNTHYQPTAKNLVAIADCLPASLDQLKAQLLDLDKQLYKSDAEPDYEKLAQIIELVRLAADEPQQASVTNPIAPLYPA